MNCNKVYIRTILDASAATACVLYLGRDDAPPYLVTAASSGEIFITSLDTAHDTDECAINEMFL